LFIVVRERNCCFPGGPSEIAEEWLIISSGEGSLKGWCPIASKKWTKKTTAAAGLGPELISAIQKRTPVERSHRISWGDSHGKIHAVFLGRCSR
jgi:hypothetical protein